MIKPLKGELSIPGDKSISHRAVMFGSISQGSSIITNFLEGADCLSTIECFRKMGANIRVLDNGRVQVTGKGLYGLSAFDDTLNTGNSGTTTRLMSGILCGQSFPSRLTGDESIESRPMKRIITPLSLMGADIKSERGNDCAPLVIEPSNLNGIEYDSPVASAQVKSAILLAGLYAKGPTTVIEPVLSRDHTERMLRMLGANVISDGNKATIIPGDELISRDIVVPGDISSAAYFIAAASIVPGSELLLKNVGLNPTRAGIIKVLKAMGGDYEIVNGGDSTNTTGEPAGDILIKHAPLHSTVIEGEIIPTLIDEIPVIAVMAAAASGETIIRDAAELKVKESDRIAVMTDNLRAIGVDVTPTPDGMIIRGREGSFEGGSVDPQKDHRVAMSFAVAELIAREPITIKDRDCVNISYPGFFDDLEKLM